MELPLWLKKTNKSPEVFPYFGQTPALFFIIKKVGIFHKLSIKLDSIEKDIIEIISTEYVMYSKLCAINLGLLNPAAHLIFKRSLCKGSLVFNILSFFQLV